MCLQIASYLDPGVQPVRRAQSSAHGVSRLNRRELRHLRPGARERDLKGSPAPPWQEQRAAGIPLRAGREQRQAGNSSRQAGTAAGIPLWAGRQASLCGQERQSSARLADCGSLRGLQSKQLCSRRAHSWTEREARGGEAPFVVTPSTRTPAAAL